MLNLTTNAHCPILLLATTKPSLATKLQVKHFCINIYSWVTFFLHKALKRGIFVRKTTDTLLSAHVCNGPIQSTRMSVQRVTVWTMPLFHTYIIENRTNICTDILQREIYICIHQNSKITCWSYRSVMALASMFPPGIKWNMSNEQAQQ